MGGTPEERGTTAETTGAANKRSLPQMILQSRVDPAGVGPSPDVVGVASGLAFATSMAALYLLGESWSSLRIVHIVTLVAGFGVGLAGTFDLIAKRPTKLVVPLAHALIVVLAVTLTLRYAGYVGASRQALAWSLGLHLCLLPLTARLWAVFFAERASGLDVARRRRLLGLAKRGELETLMIRVLETDPGFTEGKVIGHSGSGRLRMHTALLSPRPRPGFVYVLSKSIVINRSVPGTGEKGEWARYLVRADEIVLLGERAQVAEASESLSLAYKALAALAVLSAVLLALSAVAAL